MSVEQARVCQSCGVRQECLLNDTFADVPFYVVMRGLNEAYMHLYAESCLVPIRSAV